jgi:hypothetical protein
MKLVFGKGRVSREEIEQQAATEIENLISSADGPPPIDWDVYGFSGDVADPAVASAGLAESARNGALDEVNGASATSHPTAAPRAASGSRSATATKAKPKTKAKPRARAPKKTTA